MVDSSPHPLSLCNIEVIWKIKLDRSKANDKEKSSRKAADGIILKR